MVDSMLAVLAWYKSFHIVSVRVKTVGMFGLCNDRFGTSLQILFRLVTGEGDQDQYLTSK